MVEEAILILPNLCLPQALAVVSIFTDGRDRLPLFRSQSPIRNGSGMNGGLHASCPFILHSITYRRACLSSFVALSSCDGAHSASKIAGYWDTKSSYHRRRQ